MRIVFSGRQLRCNSFACSRSLKQFFEKRPAPAAACPGPMALGELTFPLRALDTEEINHLPLGDVKAKTKLVIGFHNTRVT